MNNNQNPEESHRMENKNEYKGLKAVYYTLGCKLNFAETSSVGRTLKDLGVRTVRTGETADLCIVNTCSVTEVADHKCRQAIHRLVKKHPSAFVIVTGCYAQLKPGDVSGIEGVDLVLGAEQKGDIIKYIDEYIAIAKEKKFSQIIHLYIQL